MAGDNTNPSQMQTRGDTQSSAPISNLSTRLFGVIILLFILGFLFVYGFVGYIINENTSWLIITPITLQLSQYFSYYNLITLFFILVGFGCLFNSMSNVTITGFFTALFIVSFTTLLSPLLQKWWYDVFTGGFNELNPYTATNVGGDDYRHYMSGKNINLSFYSLKISQLNVISQLVIFYGVMQKLHAGQIFIFSIFYQIAWTLNFHLCVQVSLNSPNG